MLETNKNSYFSPTTPIMDGCITNSNIEQKQRSENFYTVWQNYERYITPKTDDENKKD